MSLFGDVRALKEQRRRELELLEARMVRVADALECQPAQWVGEHPYIAIGGAAAIGFLAAQLPSRAAPRAAAAKPARREDPPRPSPASAAPQTPGPSRHGEIVELLIDLAVSLLQPGSAGATESTPPARLTPGNAGSIRGNMFPAGVDATGDCVTG